ncbi:MAG: VacJ family lipoprotein [Alphaproteobacteria bacterium]|nr:VacJ family lipoprotein [Alphaproteobacteria bacterium]
MLRRLAATLLIGAALAGCASKPPANDPEALAIYRENNDPVEPLNRAVLGVNEGLEFWILRPLAVTYRDLVPNLVQRMVSNFLDNLTQPLYAINAALQGNGKGTGNALGRFVINSTVGLAGLFDVVPEVPNVKYDFGATLAKYGVEPGPYLVLPVLGPYSLRDGGGLLIDGFMDPVGWVFEARGVPSTIGINNATWAIGLSKAFTGYASNMQTIDELRNNSLDFYATLRSAQRQRRAEQLRTMGITPDKSN